MLSETLPFQYLQICNACIFHRKCQKQTEKSKFCAMIGDDFESSLLSFEKLDRASPDLWPEQLPGVAEFAASCKNPITNSPPKWMAELESEDIEMLKELGSLTTANLMEKVKGLQNLAYQLGLEESREMTRGKFLNILERPKK
uniref:Protein lin-52 homolog n=1 Tax=Sander lucioperca TaxID=283035 RepID=A0A8C9XJR3_SANLU